MKNGLNIPLEDTTRQTSWRVVWICIFIGAILCALFFLSRLQAVRDTTSALRPMEADSTLHMVKTPRTMAWVDENLGIQPVFANSPWTYRDMLSLSRKEFSLHFKQGELIAITFDGALSDAMKAQASAWGFYPISEERRTLLSTTNNSTSKAGTYWHISNIFPWNRAIMLWNEQESTSRIRLKERKFVIRTPGATSAETSVFLPKGAESLALFTTEQAHIPHLLARQLPVAVSESLGQLLEGRVTIGLAKDAQGLIYVVNSAASDISMDELTRLSKEILSRYALTRTALTLDDGTTATELRTDTEHITVSIRTQDEATFLTAQHRSGNMIRITKTADRLFLTNREYSAEVSEFIVGEVCDIQPNAFIHLSAIATLQQQHVAYQPAFEQPIYSFFPFSHLAFTDRKIIGCW